MNYGLTEKQLYEIREVLRKYPQVKEAIIFGSRAMGNYKKGSDIDIALKGEVSSSDADAVKDELEDTYLPFFFDVIAYNTISNEKLRIHIDTCGGKLYETCGFIL